MSGMYIFETKKSRALVMLPSGEELDLKNPAEFFNNPKVAFAMASVGMPEEEGHIYDIDPDKEKEAFQLYMDMASEES